MLRRIDYGESDQIIKIFLKEEGRVSGIAKGIKKSKRRFPHRLEPFRRYNFILQRKPGQNLYFIRAADQIMDYEGIKENLTRFALGNVILETILNGVKESHPHTDLYAFVLLIFNELNSTNDCYPLWFYATIHIMRLLGFSPNFESCLTCKLPLSGKEKIYMAPTQGGILCSRCAQYSRISCMATRPETLGALQFLKKTSVQAATRLKISESSGAEIEGFLTAFTHYYLEQPLKSIPLLKEALQHPQKG